MMTPIKSRNARDPNNAARIIVEVLSVVGATVVVGSIITAEMLYLKYVRCTFIIPSLL